LAALAVRDAEGTDLAVGADVTASSSRETGGWGREHLVDGVYESQLAATSPLLRTTVELSTPVKRARVHVAALGYGELYVNGDRVGDAVLDPGWTDYDERVLYTTHDLTDRLHEGTNAIGLWLGIGRFARTFYNATGHGSPRALVHLTVEYTDGTTRTVASGPDWTATDSPVRANDIYDGERYDARRERSLDGWATPGFDDADWADAAPMPAPGGQLSPQRVEPIRVTETFDVQIVDETEGGATGEPGVTLDVGQNLVGWVELELEDAAAGDEVELAYAEALDEENAPLTTDLGAAEATDAYVARGDGPETYEPRFTYHGFRYVRVTGYSGSLDPSDVTAKAVHTDFEPTGSFDCSNEELVRVQHAAEWSLRGNAHSLPTDCPQRAERFGWTGDGHISARAFCYNFDARRFHEKWQRDHDDCQSPHGYVADTIPFGIGTRPADPTWSVTRILIPWFLYRHYGDERVLERHYEAMRRYVDYWHAQADNGVIPRKYGHYGDWLTFEHRDDLDERRGQPFELFNTAYHYHTLDVFAQIADVLGQSADADRYRKFAEETRAAFNDAFFDPDVGQYEPRIQAAQAVALFFGLVPDRQSTRVVENLVEEIHEDGDRLMTGFLGTRPLIHTLADHGYADLAYRLVSQPERPGWVYMTRQGATTLWERWDSDDQVGSGMNSFNHSPFTLVSEWFYEQLAGLRFDPDGLAVAPSVVEGLEWVDASVDTAEGPFAARWDRTDRGITLLVTIPWNREATIHLPGSAADIVSVTDASGAYILDGRTVPDTLPDGVESVILDSSVRLQVSAGNYELRIDAGAD
jgi:alpha-L-rhamnosidase